MEQIAKIETLDDALRAGASFGFETAMSFAIGIVLNAVKNASVIVCRVWAKYKTREGK